MILEFGVGSLHFSEPRLCFAGEQCFGLRILLPVDLDLHRLLQCLSDRRLHPAEHDVVQRVEQVLGIFELEHGILKADEGGMQPDFTLGPSQVQRLQQQQPVVVAGQTRRPG